MMVKGRTSPKVASGCHWAPERTGVKLTHGLHSILFQSEILFDLGEVKQNQIECR